MAIVWLTRLIWVQSTIAVSYVMVSSDILDNMVYMGTVNNGNNTCHVDVCSAQPTIVKFVFNIYIGDTPPISSHLMQSTLFPPLLYNDEQEQQNKQTRKISKQEKNVLSINNLLYCIDLLKIERKQDCPI